MKPPLKITKLGFNALKINLFLIKKLRFVTWIVVQKSVNA